MKHCLFYGSLKRGEYNFNPLTQTYLKTFKLDGYDLYHIQGYPAAIKGRGKITVELHEVDDDIFDAIYAAETNHGCYENKLNIDGIDASIFLYNNVFFERNKIADGNWTQKE